MATRMQQRRGTATQWTTANPILNVAEIGYETDTNKFKIGDGTNHWADLNYFVDGAELSNIIDGAPALLDTLNELAAAIGDDPTFITTVATNLSNHASDSTNIHGIADTAELATKTYVNTAVGNIDLSGKQNVVSGVSSTEIGYLDGVTSKIQDQLNDKASSTDLSNHTSDTTSVHGIEDTSLLVTTTGSQTLSNKTLALPTITLGPGSYTPGTSYMNLGSINVTLGNIYDAHYSLNGKYSLEIYQNWDSSLNIGDFVFLYSEGNNTLNNTVWEVYDINSSYVMLDSAEVQPGDFYGVTITAVRQSIEGTQKIVSSTELGHLDGVTSAIQTQLDAKAPLASPVFTGDVDFTTADTVDFTGTTLSGIDLLPSQTGNAGNVLTTDGTNASWTGPVIVKWNSSYGVNIFIGSALPAALA